MTQEEETSFVVGRVTMEDNIFAKNARRDYTASERGFIRYSPVEPPKESKLSQLSSGVILVCVVIEVILGYFANSLALIADACRQFSDHLEQHKYDHSTSPAHRIREVIMMAVPCVITSILCVVFLVNASTRAANPTFEIHFLYLLIGTVLAAVINALQIAMHFQSWKATRSYTIMHFAKNHRSQCLHGLINHGLALTIIIVTILILTSDSMNLADSVGTYLITALIVTNIAAASRTCYQEYCDLEITRADYEEL